MIREAGERDLFGLLALYTHLHERTISPDSESLQSVWRAILQNPDYHLIVAEEDGKIVSGCTCLIVPNLTHDHRPYALIENVVTDSEYRGRGLAGECLALAKKTAEKAGCYKLMLITGSHEESTHHFYQKNGYSSEGKTAYYQILIDDGTLH